MPSHFDRFRFLNDPGGRNIKNESEKMIYVKAFETDPPIHVPPGSTMPLPETPEGESIVCIETIN